MLDKVIIWGLRDSWHTHRHIHSSFFKAFKYMGYETYWLNSLEEAKKNGIKMENAFILHSDTDFPTEDPPICKTCFYFLHFLEDTFASTVKSTLGSGNLCQFLFYDNSKDSWVNNVRLGPCVYWNESKNTILFPWATNLLPHEIQKNMEMLDHLEKRDIVIHVGSFCNGWEKPYQEYARHMRVHGIPFRNMFNISDDDNELVVKHSYAAPALQFATQVAGSYLPCRIFKNISYGAMGITNNKYVHEYFGKELLYSEDLKELADMTIDFNNKPLLEKNKRIKGLMQKVMNDETYVSRIEMILRCISDSKSVTLNKK